MPQLDGLTPQRSILYINTGVGVFAGIGNPNGVEKGGIGSEYTDLLTGDKYVKTTLFDTLTGWVSFGGGGGSGTVTSVGLSMPGIFSVAGSPITTSGTFNVTLNSQAQSNVFAAPSGSAGTPTFRLLQINEITPTGIPINGIPYSTGSQIVGDTGFLFDPATSTLQMGVAGGISGKVQLRSNTSGSVRFNVNTPSSNHEWFFPNALPSTNDLLTASAVSGNNITLGWIAPSGLGFPTINPTNNVIPYRSSSSAFSDSPVRRLSTNAIGFGTASTDVCFTQGISGVFGIGRGDSVVTAMPVEASGYYCNQFNNQTAAITCSLERLIGLSLGNNLVVGWQASASGNPSPTLDTSFSRLAANVVRVGNGSTGAGQLVVGASTASTSNQLTVDSQSSSRIAGFFSMTGTPTVPTIQGVISGIQSFGLFPSGKLVGGCNIPTTNQQFSAIGNAKSDVSTIGNVGTGTDNLLSFDIQANVLNNNGDYSEFDAFGEFENNANNKRLAIVFGGTTIFNTGAVAFGSVALTSWRTNTKIVRTGSSSQKCITTFWSTDPSTPFLQEIFLSGENLTINRTVQFQAEATSNYDVVQYHLESKLCVAQTS